jgi:hypothetical protein
VGSIPASRTSKARGLTPQGVSPIYDVVTDEFSTLLQLQKDVFPDAAMVMIDLVIAHNNAAVVLLDLHLSRSQQGPGRFTEQDLMIRQAKHTVAAVALRNYILKKTH